MKYVRRFRSLSTATCDLNLVSPNLSFIDEANKLLMKSTGITDEPLLIKIDPISGKPVIEEKPQGENWFISGLFIPEKIKISIKESFTSNGNDYDEIKIENFVISYGKNQNYTAVFDTEDYWVDTAYQFVNFNKQIIGANKTLLNLYCGIQLSSDKNYIYFNLEHVDLRAYNCKLLAEANMSWFDWCNQENIYEKQYYKVIHNGYHHLYATDDSVYGNSIYLSESNDYSGPDCKGGDLIVSNKTYFEMVAF